CPMKAQYQISVMIDEIYANIASYSGASQAEVAFDFDEGSRTVTLTFTDDGKPYNPLEAKEPDTSLSADERPIGGLGIFIVRKTMDEVDYEYREGKNVLTLKKAV
ncbi:MAG: ATP-binding protein, partial [Clostridia bacterium]|nr:ATP-binding protein [Clostridia bacterium]